MTMPGLSEGEFLLADASYTMQHVRRVIRKLRRPTEK